MTKTFCLVFVLMWLGGTIVTINSILLGAKMYLLNFLIFIQYPMPVPLRFRILFVSYSFSFYFNKLPTIYDDGFDSLYDWRRSFFVGLYFFYCLYGGHSGPRKKRFVSISDLSFLLCFYMLSFTKIIIKILRLIVQNLENYPAIFQVLFFTHEIFSISIKLIHK